MLEPVYIKRQSQRCNNSAMKLAILFSLKTMELLQTEVATHFSQSCGSVDADAWYKPVLTQYRGSVTDWLPKHDY